MDNILNTITAYREERKWSLYDLAIHAEMKSTTISTWYNEDTIPSIPSLVKICDAFQITLSEFFAKAEGSESKRSWHPQYPLPVQCLGWQIHDGCGLQLLPSSFLPAKAADLCHAPSHRLFYGHHPGNQNRSLRQLEAPKERIPLRRRLQYLSPRPQRTPAAAKSLRHPAQCFCGQMR